MDDEVRKCTVHKGATISFNEQLIVKIIGLV